MPPPWLVGQKYGMIPPPSPISSQQSTGSEHSSVSPTAPTTPNRATPVSRVSMKENTALPPINHASLITPQAVIDKYPKLLKESKLPMLSIRLAQEAFFGKEVMSFCTFKGVGSYHALPETETKKLKEFLKMLALPGIVSTAVDFEMLWKKCIESIGQSCKGLRLANLELK